MVNIDTPTSQVVKHRQAILRLAQLVFGNSASSAIRAFNQFADEDLAKLIDAKRGEDFDFGACLIQIENKTVWPTKKDLLMEMYMSSPTAADLLTTYDHAGLEGDILAYLEKNIKKISPAAVVEKKPKAEAKTARPTEEEIKEEVQTTPEAPPVETKAPNEEEEKVLKFARKKKDKAPDAAPQQPLVGNDLSPVLEAVANLRKDLAEGLEGAFAQSEVSTNKKFQIVEEKFDMLLSALWAMNQNIALVLDIGQDERFIHFDHPVVGVDNGAPEGDKQVTQVVKKAAPPPKQIAKEPEPEEAPEQVQTEYSEEDINQMGLDELRTLAESMGIPNAQKGTIPEMLRRKILQAAAQ